MRPSFISTPLNTNVVACICVCFHLGKGYKRISFVKHFVVELRFYVRAEIVECDLKLNDGIVVLHIRVCTYMLAYFQKYTGLLKVRNPLFENFRMIYSDLILVNTKA